MKKIKFLLWLFVFAFVLQNQTNAAETQVENNLVNEKGMSRSQYVTGGVLGSIFGFGIGHAVQGRYSERGWIFTAGDATGILLLANANCFRGRNTNSPDRSVRERSDCENTGQALLGTSLIIGSHVLQVLDLWVWGKPQLDKEVSSQLQSKSQLMILPGDQNGTLVYSLTF